MIPQLTDWTDVSTGMRPNYLRQVGVPHQIAIAFPGGATAFVECPDDQALAATAIAGGEDPFEVGGIPFEFGFDVGAGVALHAERLEQGLFRTQKSHRQEDELNWAKLLRAWNLFRNE